MTAALPDRLAAPALAGLWERCWRQLARAGDTPWPERTLGVPVGDDATRHALAGLLGRPIRPGTASTRIHLGDLDQRIRTPGDGWDLVAVVEAVHGPLPDRRGAARRREAAIDRARADALDAAGGDAEVARWVDGVDRGVLARLHGRGELALLPTAARILATLPVDGVPLPVLARRLTGDTKALGATALATLVLSGLAHLAGVTAPSSAAERRELWESVGVVVDDLASQVLVLNLRVEGGPVGRFLREAADEGLPARVTLQQLQRHPVTPTAPGPVWVCENPAVLRTAVEELGRDAGPLVCTEGRPSVACVRLLTALAASGVEVRVHADLDWAGVGIVGALLDVPGAQPWRFRGGDYLDALARTAATQGPDGDLALTGRPTATPWDPALAEAMQQHGRIVYEEDVLDLLLSDLRILR